MSKQFIFFSTFLFLLLGSNLKSQELFKINGQIKDSQNTAIPFAAIYCDSLETGSESDENGNFEIELPLGAHKLTAYAIGYTDIFFNLDVKSSMQYNITLKEVDAIGEVVIQGRKNIKVESVQMSTEKITMEEAKKLPALFGEVDIIKSLQLKPGISSGGEGTSGINVRGGGQDQNLFLFDGATIYNASHLFGFFSTFNTDAIEAVEVYKGGFPARYGGRLSSVLDISQKKGSKDTFDVSGGLGLIASRLSVSGPIIKDKLSFLVSGRRTYVDLFTNAINKANEKSIEKENETLSANGEATKSFTPIPSYFFHDLNGGLSWNVNGNNTVEFSGYYGLDDFGVDLNGLNFSFNWGNLVGSTRWKSIISEKWAMNTAFNASRYRYKIDNSVDNFSFALSSAINDYEIKNDHSWFINEKNHILRSGISARYQKFNVGSFEATDRENFDLEGGQKPEGYELSAYVSDEYAWSDQFKTDLGLRFNSYLSAKGTYYPRIEPRTSLRYAFSDSLSIKASYTMMHQNVHLISSSGSSLPTDIWYPSTNNIAPQRSQQIATGVSWQMSKSYLFSVELFHKWANNQVDFRDYANLFANQNFEREFVFGKGNSSGAEFYLEKTKGKLNGWIGYTLSNTVRKFNDINDGEKFFPRYHRLHDLSIVGIWDVSKKISLSATWVFNSGAFIALPQGRIISQDPITGDLSFIPLYTKRGGYQQPDYHRLDVGVIIHFFPKWGASDLSISAYNAYNRLNPYFIFFDGLDANGESAEDDEDIVQFKAKQVSLFPIIPSVTYNFNF